MSRLRSGRSGGVHPSLGGGNPGSIDHGNLGPDPKGGDAKESAYLPDEVDTGTGVTVDRFDLTETVRMGRSSMGALLAV